VQACEKGNSSLYINGVDPGFSADTLTHTALSLVTRARSVTVQEIFDYDNYDDAEFTGAGMGFNKGPDDDPPLLFQPGIVDFMWGGQVRRLADLMRIKLDETRQRTESWYTPDTIECTMMTVQP
jgi:hypothetical protein